jgi:O-antigen/teichoic acid export membrane protein
VAGAVIGFVVGQALSGVAAVVVAARAAPSAEGIGHGVMRGVFRFGAKTWSADMLQLLNYRLDIFLLNAFADSRAVGVYAVAVAVTSLGWMVPHALASVVFPRTARLASMDELGREPQVANDAAVVALRHATALVPLTALALSVLVAIGVPVLYGPEFHDTIALAFLLLPGALALGVGKVVSAIVTGRGHPEYSLYNTLITVPITIGLYIGLIPTLGAVGAAIASTISYLLTTAIAFAFLKRVANVRLGQIVGSLSAVVADYRAALAMLRAYPGDRR